MSQTKTIDSLKNELANAKNIAQKKAAVFSLCEQGVNIHPDTLLAYAGIVYNIALQEHNIAEEVKSKYYQCIAYTTKGLIDSSLRIADECKEILSGKVNDPLLLANVYNQVGRCFMRKSEYNDAIEVGYKVISLAEKNKDELLQIKGKTLVGWSYLEMGQNNNALLWLLKAFHTATSENILEKYGILFADIALTYGNLDKQDSAFYYINKAILFSRKHEDLFALSNSLAIKSQLYIKAGNPSLAEPCLEEMVTIRKLIGDPFYIVSDMSQLGLYYAHYGTPEKGIAICNEGIDIARKYHLDSKLIFLYSSLGENYRVMGNTAMYANVLEHIISLKDTVFKKNSAQALAEIQTKFEIQKKENYIIQQQLEINRQKYLFYGLLILAFFSVIVAWLLFRGYKKRQQLKLEQMQEEEKRQSVMAVINASEAERKRISADLHDNLGVYAASIAATIDNITHNESEEISPAMLNELRNNSRAIVSQLIDTIWVLKKENLSLTAISDRVKVFIQRIRSGYPAVNIDVTEDIIDDLLMPAPRAFHLFRIVQEAITNALKHSDARNICIHIESGPAWKITISDDGSGIEKNNGKSGDGITNMNNRAGEAAFTINWRKNIPAGTNVVVEPTTN